MSSLLVAYLRVSTERQGDSGAGLAAQRATIEREAAARGWRLQGTEIDVLSGKTLNRPGLTNALTLCRTGAVDGLVVAKLDRLSRSLMNFAKLVDEAKRYGFNIVALDLGVDLSTSAGEFLANVMASAAAWEGRVISERTRDALAARKAAGVKLGRPPRGPDPVATRIVNMRAKGMTLAAISGRLNQDAVPTYRGGKLWRPSSVRAVLNRVKP